MEVLSERRSGLQLVLLAQSTGRLLDHSGSAFSVLAHPF